MNKFSLTAYPWALAYGVYMYVLFQAMFYLQFRVFNLSVDLIDIGIYVVGVGSVALLFFFIHKLPRKRWLMMIPFIVALPFGYIGTLGGGLLGILGMVAFGLIPFAVVLSIGYFIIKWTLSRGQSAPKMGTRNVPNSESAIQDGSN